MTIDFAGDQIGVQLQLLIERARYERWLLNETDALINREFERIVTLLASPKFRDLTQFQKQRAAQLFRELDRQIRSGYSGVTQFHISEMKGYASLESELARVQVRSILGSASVKQSLGAFLPRHTLKSIAALPIQGLNIGQWFEGQANTMTLETRRIIQQGLIEGKGPLEVARRIMATDKAQGPVLVRRARNEARAITRTSFTAVQNTAAMESYEAMPEEVTASYTWRSLHDSRVSAICRALDGRVFSYKDEKRRVPPAHILCRSGIEPNILDANGKIIEIARGPRSFASYNDWLKSQPVAEQNRILGPTRAQYWRDGKLSLRDTIDADNRVLTLPQLRARLNIDQAIEVAA